jgi:hypothetical protein
MAHLAAQALTDRPSLVGFYDRHLRRRGTFPILARDLSDRA